MNINFSLKNKNIILTGAAGILGQKLSQAYLDAGANLALLDINKNELDKLQKNLRSKKNNYFNVHYMLLPLPKFSVSKKYWPFVLKKNHS